MDNILGRYRRNVFLAVFAYLSLVLALVLGSGCRLAIPVTLEPGEDAAGKPVPVLMAIEPRKDASGKPIPVPVAQTEPPPVLPLPEFAPVTATPAPIPRPVGVDWVAILATLGGIVGAAGAGWGGLASLAARKLHTALEVTAAHADRMEEAETDEDVARAKVTAQVEQEVKGVRQVIQRARGKK